MPIPSEARVLWPGTVASIPANWSRDTNFDDRYLQGSATAGTNAGASTHGHTISGSHTHAATDHVHTLTVTGTSSGSGVADNSTKGFTASNSAHTHGGSANTATASSLAAPEASITVTSSASHPPYFEFIVLQPDNSSRDVPTNAVVLSDGMTLTGFTQYSSAEGRFVKTAPAATNGGGTGGSLTHTMATIHTHVETGSTVNSLVHNHADSPFTAELGLNASVASAKGLTVATSGAHHTATAIQTVTPTVDDNNFNTDSASSEPAYVYLTPWQNGGSAATPNGIIIPFTGTTIPAGWIVCDGTNGTVDLTSRQIKCSASLSGTGGSDSHSHTTTAHTHTSPTHTHTFTNTISSGVTQTLRAGFSAATSTHTHTSLDLGTLALTLASTSVGTTSSDDIRYLYRTCKFITNRVATVYIKGKTKILGKALIK